jgi:hypothetical protein
MSAKAGSERRLAQVFLNPHAMSEVALGQPLYLHPYTHTSHYRSGRRM